MSDVEGQADWPSDDVDDVLPLVATLVAEVSAFAIATMFAADGGPRPVGSQMLVTRDRAWGFVSGNCVEADVARQARDALTDWHPRRVAYGHGGPFFDIRLPCGGRIDLLIEPILPDDPTIRALLQATRDRRSSRYVTDGSTRRLLRPEERPDGTWVVDRLHEPAQRLVVIGGDPFALAIALAGIHQGWDVTIVRPGGPAQPPPFAAAYLRDAPDAAIDRLVPDPWTAIAVATHDMDLDQAALLAALRSKAGYVGVLGSRHRLEARRARLAEAGLRPDEMARLRSPIGLPIMARSPREIAVTVVGEIIERRRSPAPRTSGEARWDGRSRALADPAT